MSSRENSERFVINVSGEIYETFEDTLNRFPDTLLATPHRRYPFYCFHSQQYFFNRNRNCFAYILFFYQSNGILRCPSDIPVKFFEDECRFFHLPDDKISNMKEMAGILPEVQKIKEGSFDHAGTFRAKVWNLLDNPETSSAARYILITSSVAIFLSTVTACLSTVPSFNMSHENVGYNLWFLIEFCFNLYFLLELLARFCFCPDKLKFLRNSRTLMDALATLPCFIVIWIQSSGVLPFAFLRIFRFFRIVRLFRLHKAYYCKLRIVFAIIRSAISDFKMLVVLLFFTITLVGNAMYFIERSSISSFTDVPNSKWWAVITLTTSGYGDIIPVTVFGRIVASFYMLFGAMAITLPALSIGSKLKIVYDKNVRLDVLISD